MSRSKARISDIKNTLMTLKDLGMEPCALDTLPDGTHRWHFTTPLDHGDDALDRELEAFEAKHGHGRS